MSGVNAGGVSFDISLTGQKKSLKAIRDIKNDLEALNGVFKGNKVAQKEYISELRAMGGAYADAVRGVKNTHQLYSKLGKMEESLTAMMRKETKTRETIAQNSRAKLNKLYQADTRRKMQEISKVVNYSGVELRNKATQRWDSPTASQTGLADPKSGFRAWSRQQTARVNDKDLAQNIKLVTSRTIEQTAALRKQASAEERISRLIRQSAINYKQLDTSALKPVVKQETLLARVLGNTKAKFTSSAQSIDKYKTRLQETKSKLSGLVDKMAKLGYTGDKVKLTKLSAGMNKVSTSTAKMNSGLSRQTSLWAKLRASMNTSGADYTTWWKRFGVIALGFAVAYRAIYSVQLAIGGLARAFSGGLTVMDDYAEGLATISGMIALTYTSSGTFVDRFIAAQDLMSKSMENAMRLAPKYRLSMEEITAGFRELAQFGVVVTPEETERSLNTLAMIKEISLSSGSTTKQIRQELQALFQGQARVTDQFTRMIKITMPDLYRTLQDGALSTTEKWKILNEEMWDFNKAVRESNQTVKNQALIAKGTLQIISKMALEHSGVFSQWVIAIREFNEKLFDTKGNLLPLGQKLQEIFGDIWTSINYAVHALLDFGKILKDVYDIVANVLSPWKQFFIITGKTLALMFILKTVMQMTKAAAMGIVAASGFKGLIKLIPALLPGLLAIGSALATFAVYATGAVSIAYVFYTAWETAVAGVKEVWRSLIDPQFKLELYDYWDFIKNPFTYFSRPYEEYLADPKRKKLMADIAESNKEGFVAPEFNMDNIYDAMTKADGDFKDFFIGLGSTIKDGFSVTFNDKPFVEGLMDKMKELIGVDRFKELSGDLQSFADNLLKSFGDGINNIKMPELTTPTGDYGTPKTDQYQGFISGVQSWASELDNIEKMMNKLGKKVMPDLAAGFKSVVGDVFSGEITKFSDLWDGVMQSIEDSFAKAMTNMVDIYIQQFMKQIVVSSGGENGWVGSVVGAISGFFTSPTAGGTVAHTGTDAHYASGGVIPEHVWGVGASGRTYEFGENGPERVLSNKESFGSNQVPTVVMNIVNKSKAPIQEEHTSRFDGKQLIVDIIVDDYSSGGATYKAFGK